MTVFRGIASHHMVGDTRLGINFVSSQMDGEITNIQDRRRNVNTFFAASQIDYDIGNFPTGRNIFDINYDGALTIGTNRIAIDGKAVGGFYKNSSRGRTSAVQAIDGTLGTDAARSISVLNTTTRLNV